MFVEDIEDRDAMRMRWLAIFVLLSLAAHALFILMLILINRHIPAFKPIIPASSPLVTLTLQPPPQPQAQKPPVFLPTNPDANAKHIDQDVESDNDTLLKSENRTARAPDSILPDVTGREHATGLANSPNVPTPNQQVTSTPPTPKQRQQQTQPRKTPPQPNADPGQFRIPGTKVVKNQVDPNGLPVLPPIDAPTIAQEAPVNVTQTANAAPSPVLPTVAAEVQGRAGMTGAPTPAAMTTELGKYKQRFYNAVASHWYPDVNSHFQILPVGMVRIQYTIHSDGRIDTKVLEGDTSTMQQLLYISRGSILTVSPFFPFTDSMREELVKKQGGDGESYTDDFTFSVY